MTRIASSDLATQAEPGSLGSADKTRLDRNFASFPGDGSDGDVVLPANTVMAAPYYGRSLTTGAFRLQTRGFPIFATVGVTVSPGGQIDADGDPAAGSVGGANGDLGASAPGGDGANIGNGHIAGGGGAVGACGYGGAGGGGGSCGGAGNPPGAGGIVNPPLAVEGSWADPQWASRGWLFSPGFSLGANFWAGGGAGGGGSDSIVPGLGSGGGAGGAAGRVIINAPTVVNNGTIAARGGAGAAGTDPGVAQAGGGGGGGGGAVYVACRSYTGAAPVVTGGAGGAGVNGGAAGAAGTAGTVKTAIL